MGEEFDLDIHERPTLPDPLLTITPSDDFFAAGVAIDLAHRRQSMLVKCVAFVTLAAAVIVILAAALDANTFMHVR